MDVSMGRQKRWDFGILLCRRGIHGNPIRCFFWIRFHRESAIIMQRNSIHRFNSGIRPIVDGFHRYRVMKEHKDIYEREHGLLPVSVIDKPLDQRMASTIRHNRARGTHDVNLMSNIIRELQELGRSDAWICKHLGMDKDEVLRLKQITGLAALFRDVDFGQAWKPVEDEEESL